MMTLPNIITLSRIGLIPVFVALFYLQPNYLEGEPLAWINNSLVAIFALISFTDFLDGLLARKLNQVSALGAFLDPVAGQTNDLHCPNTIDRLLSNLVYNNSINYHHFSRNSCLCT